MCLVKYLSRKSDTPQVKLLFKTTGLWIWIQICKNMSLLLAWWIQIRRIFWDISTRSWVISEYIYNFLTVCITVRNFFFVKKCFFDFKFSKIWTRQASFVLFLSPESWGPCLSSYDNCRLVKIKIKTSHGPYVTFPNNTFWAKKVLDRSHE
jgi:hypothetical protein